MKNEKNLVLTVSEIQRFCMHDGPGIRTTVFLKGCPLRCAWCHNPETQNHRPELLFYPTRCIGCGACLACPENVHLIGEGHVLNRTACRACGKCANACPTEALELCGTCYTVDELIPILEKDDAFFGDTGGVTLSGGEPLLQDAATVALLRACKERGLSTALETCGHVNEDTLREVIPYTDLFLWDIKDTDPVRHKQYTGADNRIILQNLLLADALGAKTRLRCILVNGVNTDTAHYHALADLVGRLAHCEGVEWIPYHAYGGTKATFLGEADNGRADWIPTEEQVSEARDLLQKQGVQTL